jgi:hypothetical protein
VSPTLDAILSERNEHLEALHGILLDVEGDITEAEAEAAIDEWLHEADAPLKEKLDAYGHLIRHRETLAKFRKDESDRLAALAQTDANTVKRLKARLMYFFESEGIEKLETDRFKFGLANNGGAVPVVVKVDARDLPYAFKRVEYIPDIAAIRTALEKGEATEYAEFGSRGRHLRIR